MACGEPQWWYDLIQQEIVDQSVFKTFIGDPPHSIGIQDTAPASVSVRSVGRIEGGIVVPDHITEAIIELLETEDKDSSDAAYERAMKGI